VKSANHSEKLLQNDPDTGRIFSQPPLISFKRDKNIGKFLVRSVFQTSEQPGTFKCARLGDRFREHLRDVEKGVQNASKPVVRHFNLPNHYKQHMAVCGVSLHQRSTESRKTLEQKFIFQIGTLKVNPDGINKRFSFD